jgi:hypothetical protein
MNYYGELFRENKELLEVGHALVEAIGRKVRKINKEVNKVLMMKVKPLIQQL